MRYWIVFALVLSGCSSGVRCGGNPGRSDPEDPAIVRLDEKIRRIEELDRDIRSRLAEIDEVERRRLAAEVSRERDDLVRLEAELPPEERKSRRGPVKSALEASGDLMTLLFDGKETARQAAEARSPWVAGFYKLIFIGIGLWAGLGPLFA